MTDTLKPNESLKPGDFLITKDGLYKFILQTDGNLVLYRDTTPLWASNTLGHEVYDATIWPNGNFVEESFGIVYWSTGTAGHIVSKLIVQNDGNVFLRSKWQCTMVTNTSETVAKVGVEWIENFDDPCKGDEVDYVGEMSRAFYAMMGLRGHIGYLNGEKMMLGQPISFTRRLVGTRLTELIMFTSARIELTVEIQETRCQFSSQIPSTDALAYQISGCLV